MIEGLIETFANLMTSNLEIVMSALWLFFAAYSIWYFTSAKKYAPLTFNEARLLWKIHKQSIHCGSRKWREIVRGGKVVGFECKCGYKHIQKCPITVNAPETAVLEKLHTTYKAQ